MMTWNNYIRKLLVCLVSKQYYCACCRIVAHPLLNTNKKEIPYLLLDNMLNSITYKYMNVAMSVIVNCARLDRPPFPSFRASTQTGIFNNYYPPNSRGNLNVTGGL